MVEKGETLWKILGRTSPSPRTGTRNASRNSGGPTRRSPTRRASHRARSSSFRPAEEPKAKDDGRTVDYTVKRGDSLSRILFSRGVPRPQLKKYLDAIREINPSVTDVNRIFAGKTLRLPTEGYFTEAKPPADRRCRDGRRRCPGTAGARRAAKPVGPPKGPEPETAPPEAGLAAVPPPAKVPPAPEVPPRRR